MSSAYLSHLTGQVLASPEHANLIETNLRAMAAHPAFAEVQVPQMADDFWPRDDEDGWMRMLRPYTVVEGILQIPIRGVLLHDFPYQFFGWATGYRYIEKAFSRGMLDPGVRGIALIIDSPGGTVAGCFDAVDRMLESRTGKPVRAFAAEMACSAAYAIAIVADTITVSRTGCVGSVGVVTSHMDFSKFYEDLGIKITFIHAGKHKVDGNSAQPLKDDVKGRIQAHVDELYGIFVAYVAENRGMEEAAVRETEALVYSASEALEVGFADAIGKLDEELAEWSAALETDLGDYTMSTKPTAAETAATFTQADIDAAKTSAKAEGVTTGAQAERQRVSAILESEEATGREATARHLALKTDMSAEDSVKLLATLPKVEAPKAQAPAPAKSLDSRMQESPAPGLSVEGGAPETEEEDDEAVVARILADSGRSTRKKS